MLRLVIAVLVLTLCSVSFAGSKAPLKPKREGAVRGYGANSCASYLEHLSESRRPGRDSCLQFVDELSADARVAFVSGYVLSANNYTSRTYGLHESLDIPTIRLFLETHCRANPLDLIQDAAVQLVIELSKKR